MAFLCIILSRGAEGGDPPVRRKDPSAQPHSQARSGSGPAREGGFRPRGWGGPHAHHVRQRNPKHLRSQGHIGETPIMRQWSGSPANVSVGRRRRRSRAAWRHRETSWRLSRWRCFRAHWAYWPCACVGPWQHPRRSGTAEVISANWHYRSVECTEHSPNLELRCSRLSTLAD